MAGRAYCILMIYYISLYRFLSLIHTCAELAVLTMLQYQITRRRILVR